MEKKAKGLRRKKGEVEEIIYNLLDCVFKHTITKPTTTKNTLLLYE